MTGDDLAQRRETAMQRKAEMIDGISKLSWPQHHADSDDPADNTSSPETNFLLRNPENARRIMEADAQIRAGEGLQYDLSEFGLGETVSSSAQNDITPLRDRVMAARKGCGQSPQGMGDSPADTLKEMRDEEKF